MSIPNAIDEKMNTCMRQLHYCSCIIHYNQVFSGENDENVDLVPIEEYYGYGNETDANGQPILIDGRPNRVQVLHRTFRCPAHEGLTLQELHEQIYQEDQLILKTSIALLENLPEEEKKEVFDPNTLELQGYNFVDQPIFSFDEDRNLLVEHTASEEVKEAVKSAVDDEFGEGSLTFEEI